jgi:hypothetical protein
MLLVHYTKRTCVSTQYTPARFFNSDLLRGLALGDPPLLEVAELALAAATAPAPLLVLLLILLFRRLLLLSGALPLLLLLVRDSCDPELQVVEQSASHMSDTVKGAIERRMHTDDTTIRKTASCDGCNEP